MLSRRQLLASTVAAGAAAALPKFALAQTTAAAQLNAFFDAYMARQLRRSPTNATSLGIDKGDLAWTKFHLGDFSLESVADAKVDTAQALAQLRSIPRAQLSGMDVVNYDTVEFSLATQDEANRAFDYGGGGAGAPYVISQLTGSYQDVPDFLDTQHTIETKADADAYLSRLEDFGRGLDDELEIAQHDVALGVVPPDFIIDKALVQMKAFADAAPETSPLVQSVVRRTKEKNIEGDYAGQARAIYLEKVLPALRRQVGFMEYLRPRAVHDAGIWRLPEGDAYYAASLKQYTTTTRSPEEIHQTGLDLLSSLGAQADKLMRKAGYTRGTVGERFAQMYADPRQHYPNTDAGKEQLIEDLNAKIKAIMPRLAPYFTTLPTDPLVIRRVPKAIEAGAPGGYYNQASLDGSRPATYWINLIDTADQPKFALPTLTYHEGIPGHHLQLSLQNQSGDLPLIRKSLWFSGYGEGWALYAEQLAVEMGMYDHDPVGHIGMLHDAMFRATRLVVDTGMHAKRWSREQALKFYMDNIGDNEGGATREIERYVVWPGQACSYMLGKLEWLRLREKAEAALGPKFDIRKFHEAGLMSGPVPLTVLERVIDNYIASAKA
ncbi:MAG TPA: DUF885 family protein [Caulobacteraceae bacterium]